MNNFIHKLGDKISGQNCDKFWKRYFAFSKSGKLKKLYLQVKLKRQLSKNCAFIGISNAPIFEDVPFLPHGLHGIHIAAGTKIGKDCTIFQNVTIGQSKMQYPTIGDGCTVGANAVIIGDVKIGNNVRIGAGTVVTADIPDNATVVMQKPRVIIKDAEYKVNEF